MKIRNKLIELMLSRSELIDLSPKLSKLFCGLKLKYIKEKYNNLLGEKYDQIISLFKIPETEERNRGILNLYSQFIKEEDTFQKAVDYAYYQMNVYSYRLGKRRDVSIYSKRICEKHLDDKVKAEWFKEIRNCGIQYEDTIEIFKSLGGISKDAKKLIETLNPFIKSLEESLETEEETIEKYAQQIKGIRQELEYLYSKDSGVNPVFRSKKRKIINSELERIYHDLCLKDKEFEILSEWSEKMVDEAESFQEIKEMEIKQGKIFLADYKYLTLKEECFELLTSIPLQCQPFAQQPAYQGGEKWNTQRVS